MTALATLEGRPVLANTIFLQAGEAPDIVEAFQRECEAIKAITHPLLPCLLNYAVNANQFTLVLDHTEGVSLLAYVTSSTTHDPERLARENPHFDLDQILQWARQLADAVLFLHLQRPFPIIHRNLSPLTVRITRPADEIKLLDFGFLNCFHPALIPGTAKKAISLGEFNDPLLVQKCWADPRVDVYSYGMVLRFLLSTLPPTVSGTSAPPPADGNIDFASISRSLNAMADRCCSASPEDRYPDMAFVVEAIRHVGSSDDHDETRWEQCACGHKNRSSARFCGNCGRSISKPVRAAAAESEESPVVCDAESEVSLLTSYRENRFADLAEYRMMETLYEIESDPGFEELLSLPNLPEVAKMQHQKDAVLRALQQMRGRALLADEVGLGKTVEAGIFLKELLLRRLVAKILIVCPSILLAAQWQSELYEKFGEIALVFGHDIDTSLAWECSRLITTYEVLGRPFHAEELLRHRYDLVILDEAHFLNDKEHAGILDTVKALQKKYFLMLSATPMHRSLEELYNIVSLLRPGHFADLSSFKKEFMEPEDEMRAKNVNTLRTLLHQIMVRNRRQDVTDYVFPRRRAVPRQLTLAREAIRFYEEFRDFLKAAVADVSNTAVLSGVADLAERLCSSPDAFTKQINQLRRNRRLRQVLGEGFLREMDDFAARCPDSIALPKLQATIEILEKHHKTRERSLVFSQFDETARYFYRRLQATSLGSCCFLYDPHTSLGARQNAVRKMEETPGGILVCPGEASEGLNLQMANLMINLDLPWNPMKLEQRIGRIQRIGGKKDILIVNLVLQGTIEEKIYEICAKRIQMFEAIVGHVEEILGNLEEDIEVLIRDFYLDRPAITDEGEEVTAEENLSRSIDKAESKSSKPGEESLSEIYGPANFEPAAAEEEEE